MQINLDYYKNKKTWKRKNLQIEFENLTNKQLKSIWCILGDGQGDTDMYKMKNMVDNHNIYREDDGLEPISYWDYMTKLFWDDNDTNGNLSFFIIIENNKPYRITW